MQGGPAWADMAQGPVKVPWVGTVLGRVSRKGPPRGRGELGRQADWGGVSEEV